jgi:small subunit ribosomal protein S17
MNLEQVTTSRTLVARVVSNKMDKTVVVVIEHRKRHPVYGKYVVKRTKLFVHDESNQCKEGDLIEIKQCRPLSKNKSWMLVKVVEAGRVLQ